MELDGTLLGAKLLELETPTVGEVLLGIDDGKELLLKRKDIIGFNSWLILSDAETSWIHKINNIIIW